MTLAASATSAALAQVTAGLAVHEERPGQQQMAAAVADAIESGRHLVVQAGTGTGKTLAYLVPAILSGKRTVVATATKALQDQLATKDLPFVVDQLAEQGVDLEWAVLKGRSNYLCLQRLREFAAPAQGQLELEPVSAMVRAEIVRVVEWAGGTHSGDVAELDWSPSDLAWRTVSVGSDECPGAERCPMGRECWAELARDRAQTADVVVVNTHLYGIDVSANGAIIPEHDVVVFDEAHGLEDIMSDTVGVELAPGRFVSLAASVRGILADQDITGSIADLASTARQALSPHAGQRLRSPLPDDVTEFLGEARLVLVRTGEALQRIDTKVEDAQQRKLRAVMMLGRTLEYVEAALAERDGTVTFVSGSPDNPRLEIAPLDVGPALRSGVWERRTAILTSATVPATLPARVGLP
jgi:ATP-dependent DNA helicase DinG